MEYRILNQVPGEPVPRETEEYHRMRAALWPLHDPDLRGQGVGRELVETAIRHLKENGIREIASDVDLDNLTSHLAHMALGFEQTHDDGIRAFYRKEI